eukprot:GHVU01231348.1.p1 GENE.GHVU01231348.1~~GHVU01231348.1.p1  ORF type:complete len:934 (-),score=116.27 GHVU01231348.1:248-3049(-)
MGRKTIDAPGGSRRHKKKKLHKTKNNARYQRKYFWDWGVKEVEHNMERKLECMLCRVDKPERSRAATGRDGSVCVETNAKLPRVPKFYKKARLRAFRTHCEKYHQSALRLFREKVASGGDLSAYDNVNVANVLDLGRDDRARVVIGRSAFEFLRRVAACSTRGPHPFKRLRHRGRGGWAVAKPCRSKTFKHLQSQLHHTASFRALAQILRTVGVNNKVDQRDTVTEALLSDVARITVGESLHHLSRIVRRSWVVTSEIDGVKVKGNKPYLTVRLNVPGPDRVWRFHLTAFRLKKKHKGLYMFKTFSMLMSALGGRRWAKQSGGLATDGAENLKGRFNGLLSHMRRHVTSGFVHHRCTPHRLSQTYNAAMKWLKEMPRLQWVRMFKSLLKLIRKQNPSEELGSLCPTTVPTRWNYFLRSISYVDMREAQIRGLGEADVPTAEWFWQLTHALCYVCELFDGAFRALQVQELLTTAVGPIFRSLQDSIVQFSGVQILPGVPPAHSPTVNCVNGIGGLHVTAGCCAVVIDEQLCEKVAEKTRRARKQLPADAELRSSAEVKVAATLVGGVCAVAVNRLLWELGDFEREGAGRVHPKLYPLDVAGQTDDEFDRLLEQMAPLMEGAFSPQQVKDLAGERRLLGIEVNSLYGLRERLQRASVVCSRDGSQKPASLEFAWKPLRGKYQLLVYFIMGVAAVSASIAGVERDNSLLKADMGEKRMNMGDVTFDARLHARQLVAVREAAGCTLPVERAWEEEDADYVTTDDFTFAGGQVEEEEEDEPFLDTLLGASPESDDDEAEDVDYLECLDPATDLALGDLASDDQDDSGTDDEDGDDSDEDSDSDGSDTSSDTGAGRRRSAPTPAGRTGARPSPSRQYPPQSSSSRHPPSSSSRPPPPSSSSRPPPSSSSRPPASSSSRTPASSSSRTPPSSSSHPIVIN